jgi:beta-fructofuranosidase
VHVTIPGFITEPSTCFHSGSFHLWPHGHIEWGTNPTHLFQHLISRDLVHWSYQPLPGWTYARACNIAVLPGGGGVTYANNAHRKNKDGTWTLGLQKWVSGSPDLLAWEKEGDIPLPAPTTGTPTLDHWIFRYNDQWHMIAASPGTQPVPGQQPTLELYRTTDPKLSSWTYVGPFYTGTHSAHHPKIFFIGEKAVIFSDIAIDAGSQYLIGRIENDRFIREGEGSFHLDETDANPFGGVITTDNGRNVLFFWMRDTFWHADHTARDAMREGWLSAYSLPRDITLAPDGRTLLFSPAQELAALREKELHHTESLPLTATPVLLTAPHHGAFEWQTTLDLHQGSTAVLTLAAAKNDHLTLICDATGQLTLDLKNAHRAARNVPQRQPATGHIPLRDGRYADLRLIWDHSLLEVYANGSCLTAWWRPDDPQAVTATLHATTGNITATQVKCWSLSTIWKDFTPAVAKTGETASVTATPALPAKVQSIALRFTAPGKGWTGTLLSRRAKPGEASLAVTAFTHEPFGKRYLGVAMDGVADGPNQTAARTVRDNVVGGHLVCAFTEMDASLDSGTHDLVFRTDGKTAELFLDGVRRESRSAERFSARTFLKLYPHHPIGEKQGSDPSGGDTFTGKLEDVKFFAHALSDEEIKTRSRGRLETPAAPQTSQKGYCTALFDPAATEEERMKATDEAMPRWLAEKLAKDVWFPRFHAALPAGMMFDTRCAIHGGRYHLYPTWRPDMNLTSGTSGAFRMQHLSSSDLIHWRINPVPMRFPDRDVCNGTPAMIEGKPQFFFLRYSRDGAPHRALPTDDTLTAWTLPEPQPAIVRDGAGYSGRLDSVVFQDNGKYYLTGTRRNTAKTSMAMPLYRSEDLTSWSYIGDFYQTDTKPFNECPQIFRVGGKMVVAAFYPLRGRHENYLVGRFENEEFIPEAGGQWDHGGHAHDRSFDAEAAPDGRVIGWSTISVYAEADALDVARQGWKGMHSIPKEVTLRPDNTLALRPAKEMEQLRSEKNTSLPKDHAGQFEIEITFAASETLTFTTPDGSCDLSFDAKTRVLTFDMTKSPKLGSDHGHIFRTPPLQNPTARLFFDRSVFEVFAGGYVLTSRYFTTAPEKMSLNTSVPIQAWKVGTIWK